MANHEIEISLTQFVDFTAKAGTTRLTEVKRIKKQQKDGYHPAKDFYRKLREGIIEYHENGFGNEYLDNLAKNITDRNKQNNYPELIYAYKRFLGRKNVDWFKPEKSNWDYKDLRININPELGLIIKDKKYLVKLYLKKDPVLTSQRINVLCNLMETLNTPVDIQCAILDLRHIKLHEFGSPKEDMMPLLLGEADAFITMYKNIKV